MMHIAGVVMALGGAALVWLALKRQREVTAAWAEAKSRGTTPGPQLHPSLVLLGDIGPPLVLFGLFVAGGMTVLAFLATGGAGVFSQVDLAGFVVLLVGYALWFRAKTRYRLDREPG